MADKTGKAKSKFFRIGTEGATTDGRNIDRAWLEQMAGSYDPKKYGARVNLEHIKGILPDSPFRCYGDVIALKTAEVEIDGKTKLTLLAQIEPTDDLVTMTNARQKIYTSMEIQPDFAKTGTAYLTGLAVTDNPASLGTEMLQFSAKASVNPLADRKQSPDNLFSAAELAVIEFEADEITEPGLLDKIRAIFSKEKQGNDARIIEVGAAIEAVAVHLSALETRVTALPSTDAKLTDLQVAHNKLQAQFTALTAHLDTLPAPVKRPAATGGNGSGDAVKTDC